MTIIDTLLAELTQEAVATRRSLERVPTDTYEWRPHPTSRSLGELATHIAELPGSIAAMAVKDRFDVAGIPQSQEVPSVSLAAALDESLAAAHATLAGLSDAQLGETWSMVAGGKVLWRCRA